ncbi:uncharacterized protein LOC133286037 [Gastrolobium bilobum]|uniref:uncharacterized protein LOC133286037 n=1 Tax=Gastrolobium bilobum TaxID=150636 RepID=UPI002AB2802E|nr:uncharacterized protein LOC133286037 [Gastrolobium bilobum]
MTKRKDFDHDFPSISPATKSRRLDGELCGTMMEEDLNAMLKQPWTIDEGSASDSASAYVPNTDERALVVYDPTKTPLLKSPSTPQFSIVVKADLIPGLKDYLLSWGTVKLDNPVEDEVRREKSSEVTKDSLAVVPWVAFHSPMACEEIAPEAGQPLEVEEGEMMEMDEPCVNNNYEKAMEIGDKVEAAGPSSPWQQQHCMMPNLLQNNSTPIHWC